MSLPCIGAIKPPELPRQSNILPALICGKSAGFKGVDRIDQQILRVVQSSRFMGIPAPNGSPDSIECDKFCVDVRRPSRRMAGVDRADAVGTLAPEPGVLRLLSGARRQP